MAATSGDGKASEAIGEIVSSGDEVDAPRGEAAVGSAANEGSSAMAAASSGGEADELIGEVARSEVNEMGDTMATAGGGGEASASKAKKKSKRSSAKKTGNQKTAAWRARHDGEEAASRNTGEQSP